MNDYYKSIRAMSEEARSLTSHAESLRACSRHSGVEFDLFAIADEYEDKAKKIEAERLSIIHVANLDAHDRSHGHSFEFDLGEKVRILEGKI